MVWYCDKHDKHSIDDVCPGCENADAEKCRKFAYDFCVWLSTPGKTIIPASACNELERRLLKFIGR